MYNRIEILRDANEHEFIVKVDDDDPVVVSIHTEAAPLLLSLGMISAFIVNQGFFEDLEDEED